jgi:hypothetical protein
MRVLSGKGIQCNILVNTNLHACWCVPHAALKRHVEAHQPARTNLSFTPLSFRAFPYVMERDTLGNRAAAKVHGTPSKAPCCAQAWQLHTCCPDAVITE